MDEADTFAIFGAGGTTGAELLRQAVARGIGVRALEHHLPDPAHRVAGAEYIQCDVLKDDLSEHLAGCTAVISALGVSFSPRTAIDPPPIYTDGTARILNAMRRIGIDRIAVISAAFVDRQPNIPAWFRLTVVPALHYIFESMRAMERLLEAEPDLKWTAARPGWLIDLPASGEAQVEPSFLPPECFRCRHADLAEFLLDVVQDGAWIGQKPAIGKPEADEQEGISALRDELTTMFASAK